MHIFCLLGVYLSLNGVIYANNSLISITEIGESNSYTSPHQSNEVQCITDRMPCCRRFHLGEWFFPNGEVVPPQGAAVSFYRNRDEYGSVNLNRFNSGVIRPTGLFCCVVPDATNVSQMLCINISKLSGISEPAFALL